MILSPTKEILSEIWMHRVRMLRVAWFDIKIENRNLYLGALWKIISPLIQLGAFWLVFGIGIRGGAPVDGVPFFIWMLAGFVPWILISQGITSGANSITSKANMIFKIKYPIPIVPVGAILRCLFDFMFMLAIMTVIYLFHGMRPVLYWLNLIYYIFFIFVFLTSLAMVLSVVVRLAKDFGKLINSLLRMLFFLTPILWQERNIPTWARPLFMANPVRYVVTGFRYSLLFQSNFYNRPLLIAFFWGVTIILLLLGCYLQKKYATRFVDWM